MLTSRKGPATALAVLIFLAAYGTWLSVSSPAPQAPSQYQTPSGTDKERNAYSNKSSIWKPNDAVSLYTLVLAAFSGLLVVVSFIEIDLLRRADKTARKLTKITRQQVKIQGAQVDILLKQKEIARQQFIAEYRPRLRVRKIRMYPLQDNQPIKLNYEIVNVGGTRARIVRNEITIRIEDPKPNLDSISDAKEVAIGREISGGEALLVAAEFETRYDHIWCLSGPRKVAPERMSVFGMIQYLDDNGIQRRTGFAQKFVGTNGRFRRLDPVDADYEYED